MSYREAILNGVKAAAELHEELGTKQTIEANRRGNIDVFGTILIRGVRLVFRPLDGLLGACVDGQGVIISTNRPLPVQRFIGAHELGHVVMRHNNSVDCEEILSGQMKGQSDLAEIEADSFAGEFLLPRWLLAYHAKRQGWGRDSMKNPALVSGLFERYREITPTLEDHPDTKWGTYFMRMTTRRDNHGGEINPLKYLIEKLRHQVAGHGPKRAVYELNAVEPFLDIPIYDPSTDKGFHMGGPCLSHLSFKLKGDKSLVLTALYRSHYYIERALGNFYGLAMLQDFVAREAGIEAAELVCLSTMAVLDKENIRKTDVTDMLDKCVGMRNASVLK